MGKNLNVGFQYSVQVIFHLHGSGTSIFLAPIPCYHKKNQFIRWITDLILYLLHILCLFLVKHFYEHFSYIVTSTSSWFPSFLSPPTVTFCAILPASFGS